MIVLLYLQGFTAGYSIKETNIFLSSDKKNDWEKPPGRKIIFFASSHLAPKYFKVVANSK